MNRLLATVTFFIATCASFNAVASCFVSNQIVERVLSYEGYGYIYFRPEASLTNSTYYYMRTESGKILNLAAEAQANRSKVNALGKADTCPDSGTARYMGDATYLYLLN